VHALLGPYLTIGGGAWNQSNDADEDDFVGIATRCASDLHKLPSMHDLPYLF
jgi:hypothetical protein